MGLFDNVENEGVSSSLIAPLKSVQRCRYKEGDSTYFHSVNYFHAILTLSGDAVFQGKDEEEFHCRRGVFFAIPAGVYYRWRILKPTLLFQCIHGPFSFLEHRGLAKLFGSSSEGVFHCEFESSVFDALLGAFESDMEEKEPAKGLKLSADWLKTMACAAAMFDAGDRARHPALAKAVEFLARNAEGCVSLKSLAKESGLGVSRISQLFRENVGMSPLSYFAMLKAERATELLMAEKLSVAEIAERLGFASGSAFRRFYKARTGVPPGRAVNRKSSL